MLLITFTLVLPWHLGLSGGVGQPLTPTLAASYAAAAASVLVLLGASVAISRLGQSARHVGAAGRSSILAALGANAVALTVIARSSPSGGMDEAGRVAALAVLAAVIALCTWTLINPRTARGQR